MSRWFKCFSLMVGGLGAWAGGELSRPALAQDGAMTELYGYGVHRYYAGDYAEAQRVLNMVVEAGIEDPRPHFFRGLTEYQLGMFDSAQANFEHAADLEARGRRAVNVSFALQRVQGPVRHDIEMARMMARVTVYREQMSQPQPSGADARPQLNVPSAPTMPGADTGLPPSLAPETEPAPGVAPPPSAIPPAEPAPPANAVPLPDTQVNPFGDDQPVPPPATEAPAPAPGTEPANPFGGAAAPAAPAPAPAAPAEPAAPADPFATPTEPAAPATPAEPAAPATPEAAPETPEATPAATPEPAAGADPFGT